jgi:hypothetical protein
MQFSAAVAIAALAGAAQASYAAYNTTTSDYAPSSIYAPEPSSVVYVTDVYTAYTTYCPEATTLTYNDVTYTISEVCGRTEGAGISLR